MEIYIQNLNWSTSTIVKMASRNAGLTAIFKKIRKQQTVSYFGDLIIFSHIVNTLADMGVVKNRAELAYALRKVPEFNDWSKIEKTELLDSYLGVFYATETVVSYSADVSKKYHD